MKQNLGLMGGLLTGASVIFLSPAAVQAQVTSITAVQLNPTPVGFDLVLETNSNARPDVFVVSRGNDFVADIINSQLRLPQGNSFRQDNPAPGVAALEVAQLDANSVRVLVRGTNGPPPGRIVQGSNQGMVVISVEPNSSLAVAPPPAAAPQLPPSSMSRNEVLVPEPAISIDGRPVGPGTPPTGPAPSFLPRAVAPPVGDIATATIDPSPSAINLNTAERIPRLVLRDAPVRDVLALLARTAGVNIAFTTGVAEGEDAEGAGAGPRISLDIEDESVQDVFNYVLRLSGLQANRVGSTIFIGAQLPSGARSIISRTFRLNQVTAQDAAGFLSSLGAETAITVTRPELVTTTIPSSVDGDPPIRRTTEITRTAIESLSYSPDHSVPILRGMQVVVDTRLNTVTLVGEPRTVEVASSYLLQLDLRKRQVAVNVKVIDINLSGQQNFNSSFSFGINDSFFVNDGGAATINLGGINPPNSLQARTGVLAPPITANPIQGDPLLDRDGLQTIPLTAPGPNGGIILRARPPVTDRPDRIGIDADSFSPFERDLSTGELSSLGEVGFALYPLFQYPTRFLSMLQAQIVSGNGKLLTDPTLVVQEGETASVRLVENVVRSVEREITRDAGGSRETETVNFEDVGLILNVQVERIDDNGFVTLTVTPDISSFGDTRQGIAGGFVAEIVRRRVESGRIRLRDGQTLILSGIIQDSERTSVSKIPLLGDLPLIGSLFRRTDTDNQRAEVIVLVTPQILDDSDQSRFGYRYNPSPDAQQLLRR